MLRKMFKNKKAQNTAEYAILISLVVAGVVAMQQFAQRALQARIKDAGTFLASSTNDIGSTVQYEPYYKESTFDSNKTESTYENIAGSTDTRGSQQTENRKGVDTTNYDGKGIGNSIYLNEIK